MTFKIGTPTTEAPSLLRDTGRPLRSPVVWAVLGALDGLADGEWLPVEFSDMKEAKRFAVLVQTKKGHIARAGFVGARRETTVYIRRNGTH